MNISYDSYRVFYYVAKMRNFTEAANVLMSNQPNVTRTIKNLESALGCRLFVRTNRGASLTPEGERLFAHVSVAVEHLTVAEEEMVSSRSVTSGVVTIAASEIALRCCLVPLLKSYRSAYPGVRIRVSNHSTPQAVEELKMGLADLAVVTTPVETAAKLVVKNVMDIQEVPICSSAYSELGGRKLTLGEINAYPIVGLGVHTASYQIYSKLFATEGLDYRPSVETATADQIIPLVNSDLGVGFVPREMLSEQDINDGLMELRLEKPLPLRQVCLVRRNDHMLNAAAREMERVIENGGV